MHINDFLWYRLQIKMKRKRRGSKNGNKDQKLLREGFIKSTNNSIVTRDWRVEIG